MSIKSLFENIANAIKNVYGTTDTLTPAEMPEAITNFNSIFQTKNLSTPISGQTTVEGCLSSLSSDLSELNGNKQNKTFSNIGSISDGQSISLSGYTEFTARPDYGNYLIPVFPVRANITTSEVIYDSTNNKSIYFTIDSNKTLTGHTTSTQPCRIDAR